MILAITADFSLFPGSTQLRCQLVSQINSVLAEQQLLWTGSDRELKVDFPIPSEIQEAKVIVTPFCTSPGSGTALFISKFLGADACHIVGVETDMFHLSTENRVNTVYRSFMSSHGLLRIAEQSGETIIRHVWDAGIIFSAAMSYYPTSSLPDELEKFISLIIMRHPMKVLELGTGVGILGITIAASNPLTQVILTDLPDAQPLVEENIHINSSKHPHLKRNVSFCSLDWEERPFPRWVTEDKFDLIVMADVTYNTATFNALADTLQYLLFHGSPGARIICCGKRRHNEEEGFWRIVRDRGINIEDRLVFAIDLEGNMRYCADGMGRDGEQVIDFIKMNVR